MSDVANGSRRRTLPFSYGNLVVAILMVVLVADVVCWATGGQLGEATMSNVFVIVCTTAIVAVLLLPWLNLRGQGRWDRAQRMDRMVYSWLAVLAAAHLAWEFTWLLFHDYILGVDAKGKLWSYLWWIYADGGDTRYFHPDSNLLALETAASIMGASALVLIYLRRKAGRFTDGQLAAVMALMACEFYSTIIYILSEVYDGFEHVTGGVANYIIKFGYGNILWLIVPNVGFFWAIQLILSRQGLLVADRDVSVNSEPSAAAESHSIT